VFIKGVIRSKGLHLSRAKVLRHFNARFLPIDKAMKAESLQITRQGVIFPDQARFFLASSGKLHLGNVKDGLTIVKDDTLGTVIKFPKKNKVYDGLARAVAASLILTCALWVLPVTMH